MANRPRRPQRGGTILIFSQVFVPDPASVGQHIADVAVELSRRGHRVRIYTADRGYDDPTARYLRRENLYGVDVRRMPFSSFGKKTILTRILGTASFMIQSLLRGLFMPDLTGIFFSTSPPLIGIITTIIHVFRRVPMVYWAMDLNPDQLIALNKIQADSSIARLLESSNQMILRSSSLVIALDRFMADRLSARAKLNGKLTIIPPWPHEQAIEPIAPADNPFRQSLGLDHKFVVMYSGNHSPSNPLTTLLNAARRLKADPNIRFLFVGGGIGKKEVEQYITEYGLNNIISLPYQPLEQLRYSLSAADVHVVTLGDGMAGIIHPCKVYGAMAVARPVLFFGPEPSHIADLLTTHDFGLHVAHGDIDAAVAAIQQLQTLSPERLASMGQTAQRLLNSTLSQSILCARLCDDVEATFQNNA